MKRIGVLFGMENSFPGALVERINARNIEGIEAEFVQTGAVYMVTDYHGVDLSKPGGIGTLEQKPVTGSFQVLQVSN